MSAALKKIREALHHALGEVDAALDGTVDDSPSGITFSDDLDQRGTVLWIRRASKSNDRIPMVAVRHGKGWSICGDPGYLTWDEMKSRYLSEPLSWFSVQPSDGMGENQAA